MKRFPIILTVLTALLLVPFNSAGSSILIFRNGFEIKPTELVHRWTFSESGGPGTALIDDIGGAHGSVIDVGSSNAWAGFGELKIAGGTRSDSDYAALPPEVLSSRTSASIEIWATKESPEAWGRVFDVGTGPFNTLFMSWSFGSDDNSDRMEWAGPDYRAVDGEMAPYVEGTEYQIVITIEKDDGGARTSRARLYRDGVFQAETIVGNILSDLLSGEFWLARSRWDSDRTAHASYNEVRIYDGVLTDEEVAARFAEGPVDDKVENSIFLSGGDYLVVGTDIQMNASVTSTGGAISQDVAWSSSNPDVATIDSAGHLGARAEGTANITVTSLADPTLSTSKAITVWHAWPVHFYDFNETGNSGTILHDSLSQADGQLIRVGTNDSSVGGGRVSLAGGDKGEADYIKLGDILTYQRPDFSIELWAATSSAQPWSRIFDFGPDTSNYLMMSWTQFSDPATDRVELDRGGVPGFQVHNTMAPYQFGVEYHIVMTVDEGGGTGGNTRVKWYRNGALKGSAETAAIWSDQFDFDNLLGRSKFPDPGANASYNEFKLYQGVLTDSEVSANYAAGPTGGGAVIQVRITGPATMQVGQQIQLAAAVSSSAGAVSQAVNWTSSDIGVATVDANGLVTGAGGGIATVTATSQVAPSASQIHSITVTVPPPVGTLAALYYPPSDQFVWFDRENYTIQTWGQPFPEGSSPSTAWSGWPSGWQPDEIDAALYYPGNGKFYLFRGTEYSRHSPSGGVDADYPKPIADDWIGWPPEFGSGDVDAAVYSPENDKIYLFKGEYYSRASFGEDQDSGYPRRIDEDWDGWPASWGDGNVDAVTYYPGNKKFYLFKGYEYARHGFAEAIDSGYPKSFSRWKSSPPKAARNLYDDFDDLKTGWTTQQWDDIEFPVGWADSRGTTNHIQGVTRLSNGHYLLSHSRSGDPGFFIEIEDNDHTFYTWSGWGDHPGSIQASGSVVAIPFSDPQEIRFAQFGANGPVELAHLHYPDDNTGVPNSVGLAYYPPHQAYYMIIGITTNASDTKEYPLYKSVPGKSLMDPSNKFTKRGEVYVEGSETGMQLVYDESTGKMHLLTLYRPEPDGLLFPTTHKAVLTQLDIPATVPDTADPPDPIPLWTSTVLYERSDFTPAGSMLVDPSFRFGAGALLDSLGRINLIATERCIPPIFGTISCNGDGDGVDYFILKP